jgi:hypothetical protein
MGIKVNKQKDAIVTTLILFNLIFLGLGLFGHQLFYFSILVNSVFLAIYYLMRIYEDKLELIIGGYSTVKKLNNMLK